MIDSEVIHQSSVNYIQMGYGKYHSVVMGDTIIHLAMTIAIHIEPR